jgi:hypothetical protein
MSSTKRSRFLLKMLFCADVLMMILFHDNVLFNLAFKKAPPHRKGVLIEKLSQNNLKNQIGSFLGKSRKLWVFEREVGLNRVIRADS